jgi:fructose-bisphosphate aldolase class I
MASPPDLHETASSLVAPGKGILAADESLSTIGKRFGAIGVPNEEEQRRRYRQLLLTTGGAPEFISGVILYDETIRQRTDDGVPFPTRLAADGIVPGIKVDTGAKPLAGAPGETVTEGLDGLRERLAQYRALGAGFAKWRAVIAVDATLPTRYCLEVNAHALARYAALCQEQGLVPIVEPEVLMDGAHDIDRCEQVTRETLRAVFAELAEQRVALDGMLLKPNMVVAGKGCPRQADVAQVATRTVRVLLETVPAAVPGIVFLSGGQSDVQATQHLNAMNAGAAARLPWQLSFSYGRALQSAALETWRGDPGRVGAAQAAYLHRARCNGAARYGRWDARLETGD